MHIQITHAFFLLPIALLTACGFGAPLPVAEVPVEAAPTEIAMGLSPQATPAVETVTPTPSATLTPTETPAPTSTPTETPTSAPTPTVAGTATPTPTDTPAPTPTATYPPPPSAVNVPILMYHYVSELPADADVYRRDLTVTPANFEAQLQYLQGQGYTTVTLPGIYETLTTGKPLPARPIVLTFDDGYKDAYTNALPLLQTYGFTGEFFVLVTPAHFESPAYVTWNDVLAMADAGMSMQAHGRDHYDLTDGDYDFLVYQILGAREAVEAHTGRTVSFFCYPSGRYNADVEAVVEAAGYLGAVTTEWGTELRLDNRYAWPRIRIKGAWGITEYASVLSSLAQ